MTDNKILKKGLIVGIIVLFIGLSITSSTARIDRTICQTLNFNGSLLGYVNDTSGNPIEGALVSVHFHETYEDDYSDSTGYYHVTNIPICYCYKNATCSKEGYQTEWVLLGIAENTTHDFILESDNHPPDAPKIKGKATIHEPGPYEYKFMATDPDGNDIRYFIDWDDSLTEWTNYYASGEEITINHSWNEMGTVRISARANDTKGALGPWGYLQWSISKEDNNEVEPQDVYQEIISYIDGEGYTCPSSKCFGIFFIYFDVFDADATIEAITNDPENRYYKVTVNSFVAEHFLWLGGGSEWVSPDLLQVWFRGIAIGNVEW